MSALKCVKAIKDMCSHGGIVWQDDSKNAEKFADTFVGGQC